MAAILFSRTPSALLPQARTLLASPFGSRGQIRTLMGFFENPNRSFFGYGPSKSSRPPPWLAYDRSSNTLRPPIWIRDAFNYYRPVPGPGRMIKVSFTFFIINALLIELWVKAHAKDRDTDEELIPLDERGPNAWEKALVASIRPEYTYHQWLAQPGGRQHTEERGVEWILQQRRSNTWLKEQGAWFREISDKNKQLPKEKDKRYRPWNLYSAWEEADKQWNGQLPPLWWFLPDSWQVTNKTK